VAMETYEVSVSNGVDKTVLGGGEADRWSGVEVAVSAGNAKVYCVGLHDRYVKISSTDQPKQFWHVDGITEVKAAGDGGAATVRAVPIAKG